MASNGTTEDTRLLEKGSQNETGEFTIHTLRIWILKEQERSYRNNLKIGY